MKKLATTEEVAEAMGTSCDMVRKLMRRGDLPGIKIGAKWYVPAAQVAWLEGAEPAKEGSEHEAA